ncbi:MAG: 3-methyl-2-oxobutanoate dehydrogenase subunit beta [marine benthic group bacterium]|nr:3-methyl-2-oxobutanoate dehydrogenase subunit beta [Gemmatimonadota bacterium]MCL7962971.1 3-methyl-2-oxobutanoate dehydrogenase subunit beta [Candidatus Carthagonibacter metallireducens]MCL7966284.1 3-methyl-2-oxobutanoate dehydrogenase subunit beta [Gemmatimonadota bacterium]
MSQTIIKDLMPKDELLASGHLACPGCAAPVAMNLVLKALGPQTVVTLPACCWSIIAGPWPQSSLRVPLFHTAFETGGAVASGIKAGLAARGDTETTVIAWAGDGGTFDIGLQALSGAAERNEDIIYFCYDNEAYMNTGIQRSSATPWGAWTTTTPTGEPEATPKKDMVSILAAHGIPYIATASVAYPVDLVEKVKRARTIRGTRFIHILAPCPPGWKTQNDETIDLARQAVQTRVFPLFEVENGRNWRLTVDHAGEPVAPYIRRQARFKHLTDEQVERIQADVDDRWDRLQRRIDCGT